MKEFVEYIVKNLVDEPSSVDVDCQDQEGQFLMEMRVAPGDVGKVVGKGGRTIKALRLISALAAMRIGRRVQLVLVEDETVS